MRSTILERSQLQVSKEGDVLMIYMRNFILRKQGGSAKPENRDLHDFRVALVPERSRLNEI